VDQNETALLYLLKDKEKGRYPVTMIRAGLHSRKRQNLLVVNAHFGFLLPPSLLAFNSELLASLSIISLYKRK